MFIFAICISSLAKCLFISELCLLESKTTHVVLIAVFPTRLHVCKLPTFHQLMPPQSGHCCSRVPEIIVGLNHSLDDLCGGQGQKGEQPNSVVPLNREPWMGRLLSLSASFLLFRSKQRLLTQLSGSHLFCLPEASSPTALLKGTKPDRTV